MKLLCYLTRWLRHARCQYNYWKWSPSWHLLIPSNLWLLVVDKSLIHCGLVTLLGDMDLLHICSGNGLLPGAPCHYLNQCQLLINEFLWHSTTGNFAVNAPATLLYNEIQTTYLKLVKIKKNLTHWGRATHICVSKLTIIGSDNGLSPERRQAIIWINAGTLLIVPLGTNFSEILIEIQIFHWRKYTWKCRLEIAAILSRL